ncbi:MAG: hypothetical protein WBA51_15095 [Erythrobacter sp.]
MSWTAAALIFAQAANGAVADDNGARALRPAPVATVQVSVQILRRVTVRFDRDSGQIAVESPMAATPQRSSDKAGTVWVEFS